MTLAWHEVAVGVWSQSLADAADLQGVRLRAEVRADDVREVVIGHGLPWFLADGSRESLDLALVRLGGGAAVPGGTELLGVVLVAGAMPGSVTIDARDDANNDLIVQLTDQAPVLPAAQAVRLGISDLSGRLVRWLVHEDVPAGRHMAVWNGTAADGRPVPSACTSTAWRPDR